MSGVLFRVVVLLTITVLAMADRSVAAEAFPKEALPGTVISEKLPDGYEPSGAVWHTRLKRFMLVNDHGVVTSMTADGDDLVHWKLAGDLEGICVADPRSDLVYVANENPDSIIEFNITTGKATRTFDLTPWLTGPGNAGLEALTFVPDSTNPEGGLFYAGLQADGKIYLFQLPMVSSSTSTEVTHKTTITPVEDRRDIAGLDYDREQKVLYAVFDSGNKLRAMKADGTFLKEWKLPGRNQEGVALHEKSLYITEDSGQVLRYSPFAGAK